MPPVIIAGAIAAAGAVTGAVISANAAENNTNSQINAANAQQAAEFAERRRIEAIATEYAKKSPEEMMAFASMLKTKEAALKQNEMLIARQNSILENLDPTIKESGKQLLQLLQGQSSKYLDPVMKNRELQRAKFEANLARTLGSGWRTTSAGIEAATKFDAQTADTINNIQAQALNQIGSLYGQGIQLNNQLTGSIQDLQKTNIGMDQAILSNEDAIKKRLIGAVQGSAQVAPINFGSTFEASKSVGQAGMGIGGALMNVGAQIGGQAIGSALSPKSDLSFLNNSQTPSYDPSSSIVGGSTGNGGGGNYSLGVDYSPLNLNWG